MQHVRIESTRVSSGVGNELKVMDFFDQPMHYSNDARENHFIFPLKNILKIIIGQVIKSVQIEIKMIKKLFFK